MISVMESVLREATAHESWSPHLRMQVKTIPNHNGLMELASSTRYIPFGFIGVLTVKEDYLFCTVTLEI